MLNKRVTTGKKCNVALHESKDIPSIDNKICYFVELHSERNRNRNATLFPTMNKKKHS